MTSSPSRRARAHILSTCVSAVLILPQIAVGQEADEALHIGEVVVSSASGIATSVQDAPASITVINAEQIQAQGARDVRDVLRKVPGLNLTQGNSGTPTVSFRGLSSSRTLMLVDGKRLSGKGTMARDYQGDYNTVPLDRIERIEVVRGPMSTLYGSDAMGGVINVITKPNAPEWSGSITTDLSYGDKPTTADSQGISAYVSGPLGQRLTLSAWAKHKEQDTPKAEPMRNADGSVMTTTSNGVTSINYRDGTTGSDTNTLGARLEWAATDTQTVGVELSHSKEDYLAGTDSALSNELKKDALSLTHDWELANGELSSYLRFEDNEQTPWDTTKKALGDTNTFKATTFETRYTTLSSLAGKDLELTFGGLLQNEKLHDPNINSNDKLVAGEATSGALYGEARLDVSDALTVTGGLRYDNHENFGGHLTPRIYANYDLGNNLVLKAGYAQAFVAPDLRSSNPDYLMSSRGNGCKPYQGPCQIYGNPNLKPETSDNFEIGVNYQGESVSWEVTAFYNDVQDMFGARRTGEKIGTSQVYERTNLDEGKTAGLEAGFSWDVSEDLNWYGTATYLAKSEFKYTGFASPFPMATTPKWNVATGVDYQANDALTLSANATYVGKQSGYILAEDLTVTQADKDAGLNPSVPAGQNAKAYVLVDIAAAYKLTDSTKLNVGVSNLFDQQPAGTVSYMEDGRTFKLGLTTNF